MLNKKASLYGLIISLMFLSITLILGFLIYSSIGEIFPAANSVNSQGQNNPPQTTAATTVNVSEDFSQALIQISQSFADNAFWIIPLIMGFFALIMIFSNSARSSGLDNVVSSGREYEFNDKTKVASGPAGINEFIDPPSRVFTTLNGKTVTLNKNHKVSEEINKTKPSTDFNKSRFD